MKGDLHMVHIKNKQLPAKKDRHRLFGSVEPGKKTKPTEKEKMPDIQNKVADYLFHLDLVGITNVKHPIIIDSSIDPKLQTTIGNFEFSSSINQHSRGTNMSRFTEQLQAYYENGFTINFKTLKTFIEELADRLGQRDAKMKVTFPWFYERKAPQTKLKGLNHADVSISISYDIEKGVEISTSLSVLVTTLCPCSKDISEYSAHNQRGRVTIDAHFTENFDESQIDWKKELLDAVETNASAPLHPVLKRPDEKVVTEQAYENPRFVEDMVRLVAADLYEMPFITKYTITCQNEESIHMHDAIAQVTIDKDRN